MRRFICFLFAFGWVAAAEAHALWLEPDGEGARLYFGEFDENLREASPGLLDRLAPPKAQVASPNGTALTVEKTATSFLLKGANVSADGAVAQQVRINERKQGDKVTRVMGFLGARYLPNLKERAALMPLDIVPGAKAGTFTVMFEGKPLAKAKVELIAESGWKRDFKSEADGGFEAAMPWRGGYVIEVEHSDTTAGTLDGQAYDTRRFVATLYVRAADGMQGPPQPPAFTPKREMMQR